MNERDELREQRNSAVRKLAEQITQTQELAEIAFADAERVERARALGEKWRRSHEMNVRMMGADLLRVLEYD